MHSISRMQSVLPPGAVEVADDQRDPSEDGADTSQAGRAWREVVVVWGASRAFFFATGALGHAFLSRVSGREPPGLLSYWANWDGGWFTRIAEHGYDTAAATVFFPLYPFSVRAVAMWFGSAPALAGWLVATVVLLFGLFFVYELGAYWWDARPSILHRLRRPRWRGAIRAARFSWLNHLRRRRIFCSATNTAPATPPTPSRASGRWWGWMRGRRRRFSVAIRSVRDRWAMSRR